MTKNLKIVLAQLNFRVGDIKGNLKKHIEAANIARDTHHADLIIFPELGITGYPPEDLLLRSAFIQEAIEAVETFTAEVKNIHALICHPLPTKHGLMNACTMVYNGNVLGQYAKHHLPNYGVFDEGRYFVPDATPCVVKINDIPVGLIICEDVWYTSPASNAVKNGARILICTNASPFSSTKYERRVDTLKKRHNETNAPIVYVNLVGGQDELIFDGGSMVIDAAGEISHFAGFFNETLHPITVSVAQPKETLLHKGATKLMDALGLVKHEADRIITNKSQLIYEALVLAVKDYINKNNIPGVLIGLSGGIDSALTLTIAVDALGKDRVHAVSMPSRFTASISKEDAALLANKLGVKLDTISIEDAYKTFLHTLTPDFLDNKNDVTHENIQSRCRAVILMALSNKTGKLVLTTGNRSEIAVGYCTLYGDMAGGFAPLRDVPKTLVYELARYRNTIEHVIPKRTIDRAPTAELSPDQKDEDTLPPYAVLDKILEAYLNNGNSIEEIVTAGFDKKRVVDVVSMVTKNQYKRKQSAIGPRINRKSFGKDWRYPVTNGFKG